MQYSKLIDAACRARYIKCAYVFVSPSAHSMNAFSRRERANCCWAVVVLMIAAGGCRSTSHAARNTTFAAPAAMGASLEDIDARNRAVIAAQLGRPVASGPATPAEVAAMTH